MDTQLITHARKKYQLIVSNFRERKNRHIIDTALFIYINGRVARFVRFAFDFVKKKIQKPSKPLFQIPSYTSADGFTAKRIFTCFNRVKGRSSSFWFYDRQPTDFDGNISDPCIENDADDFFFPNEIK